jgi:hypothetical protein
MTWLIATAVAMSLVAVAILPAASPTLITISAGAALLLAVVTAGWLWVCVGRGSLRMLPVLGQLLLQLASAGSALMRQWVLCGQCFPEDLPWIIMMHVFPILLTGKWLQPQSSWQLAGPAGLPCPCPIPRQRPHDTFPVRCRSHIRVSPWRAERRLA